MQHDQHVKDFRSGGPDTLWKTFNGSLVGVPNWSKPGVVETVKRAVAFAELQAGGRAISVYDLAQFNRRMERL